MDEGEQSRPAPDWWVTPGLEVRGGRLHVAGRDAEALARSHGTPLFAYDLTDVRERVIALQAAFDRSGLGYRVRHALKSQREPQVLATLRSLGAPGERHAVGIDACSPGEVKHSLAHGFTPDEISYTGTNVSERDFDVLLAHPIHINVDLLSQLDRLGRRAPGRRVGIRVNPRISAARPGSGISYYSGERPTKFGIYPEDIDTALAIAHRHRLEIDTVHFHVTHHLLDDDLPAFERAVGASADLVRRVVDAGHPVQEVNAGGGLGTRFMQTQRPLDLDAYVAVLARHLGPLGVVVSCEPGEYSTKHSGVLLAEVVTIERRLGETFVGLDAGWNVMHLRFVYHEFVEIVPCREPLAPRRGRVSVTGDINEGPDIFAEDYPFPPVKEGEVVALLGVGSYCQADQSTHCLRPWAPAVFFDDRI